ncbi:hypothetical protein QTP86_027920 [Hemibagrus guttatus]|nr:hypothetical protein QTP86_027920 [Hemibagrus guttatus]
MLTLASKLKKEEGMRATGAASGSNNAPHRVSIRDRLLIKEVADLEANLPRKGRELADLMERRKVDILCVQETRWKGSKAHSIGAGFKLFYYGVDSKRNGVGVVLKEEFVRNVLEVGCELEEKERFWSVLDEVMESIPTGDEEVMGKFGVKERNLEGQMVVDFAKRMDMAVVNTYFQKREEHRVTYKSGSRRKQIEMEKKTKWWKLKKEECCEEFREKLRQALGGQVVLPDDWETTAEVIRETGRKVLGVSSGRRKEDKETWWWNEEVQDSIQRKRLAKKKWDMDRTEENRQEYKELQRRVKREVSKAKQKAYDELYTRLDIRDGEKDLYRLARQRDRDGKDVQQVRVIKDRDGRVLTNLEKAYDRVPREELWYCMRKSGVAEKYVRVVQDMYERSRTVVRCAVGQTEEFKVEVGLHQGSALSPFLFAIVMDQLSDEVRQESPWTMMFADDIVICSESREQVEVNLERWRFALERRGMKVSCSKTEYMCVNEREGSGTVRLQGEEVKKVQEFKYLGSTVQSNGDCGKEVKKRVQAGWNGWRKVSGVLCERKISVRIKGKVYRTVVRPAMLYGLETVSLRKRQESELEVAELKMLRFSLGVTRLDRIRNEYIRGTAHVGRLGDKVREARLRWFGHVQRRENTCKVIFPDVNMLHHFQLTISPDEGYYQGGKFQFEIDVSEDYNMVPPKVKCLTRIWHPNIAETGEICLSLLREHSIDGTGWAPTRTLKDLLNFDDPLNIDAAEHHLRDKIPQHTFRDLLDPCLDSIEDGQRELHCVFVDLEKAYDRVPREELWYCMRKSGVAEKYVRVVQDMYERSRTVVRCAVGQTEEFKVEVGLHQGSALSPFLFAIVMDQLSEEVRQESPWTMMFADDIVICSESREQVEENLERWRFALERRGMKVSRSKTEYMCVNEREGSGTVRLQGEEVKKVQEFKYLGSTVQSNGECGKEQIP